jgi:hypothetical protein
MKFKSSVKRKQALSIIALLNTDAAGAVCSAKVAAASSLC